ncbi:MAG: MBL fold metallo-hydrolase [Candidatus Omnitrophica bacterium]|nr:MBL fold metallo-hydrolase [Candidatus Omnitrophota bacterium]
MIFKHLAVGSMGVNCYILADENTAEAVIIDPGAEADKIKTLLERSGLKAKFIVLTHGHFDHIGAVNAFNVPVHAHSGDKEMLVSARKNLSSLFSRSFEVKAPVKPLEENDTLTLGEIALKVIHTPGHTAGGISLLVLKPVNDIIFTGDTLFCDGVGRADLEGSDQEALLSSIKDKLFALPDKTVVYPGHGPKTTIGWEKKHNSFL